MFRLLWLVSVICVGLVVCMPTAGATGPYSRIQTVHFMPGPQLGVVYVDVNARCGTFLSADWTARRGQDQGSDTYWFPSSKVRFSLHLHPGLYYNVQIFCFTSSEGDDSDLQEYEVFSGGYRVFAKRVK